MIDNGDRHIEVHVNHAANNVRDANHAAQTAMRTGDHRTAPELYPLVADLTALARSTRDLAEYLSDCLNRTAPAMYYDDRGPTKEPARALAQAREGILAARVHLNDCARHLAGAHVYLGHLGIRP